MVSVSIEVQVLPGKMKEFRQAFDAILPKFRLEDGCQYYEYPDKNKPNGLSITSQWSSWEKTENHFSRKLFCILLGAINILCEQHQVRIKEGSKLMGMEAIEKVRKNVSHLH